MEADIIGPGSASNSGDFYVPPPDYQRPPEPLTAEGDRGVFNAELTRRLRWSILDPPTAAEVVELDGTGKPYWQPLLGKLNHALAEEPVTQPPRSRMLIVLDLVQSWHYWHDADAMDERPAPRVIENPQGQPITFAQFIHGLHEYALELRELIFEIEDRGDSENARLYCFGASGVKRRDAGNLNAVFRVHVDSDSVNNDQGFEETWRKMAEWLREKACLDP